jgi:RNA polymerase sigma factor (sigma-70 family)
LVARFAAQGDEVAFEVLVKRHGPMVLRVCRRVLGNDHDAEDAFQATFLVLSRRTASLRRQESVASWLYGAAYRLALNARAKAARQRCHESRAAPRLASDPLEEITVREAQAILEDELARLPEKYRAPLVLCCLEGLARDEAAQQLGMAVTKVQSRLQAARERLRCRLKRRGLTVPAALLAALTSEGAAQAVVPGALVRGAVQGARVFAAGSAGAQGVVSAKVAALVEEALPTALAARLKLAAALVLLAVLAGVGAAFVAGNVPDPLPARPAQRHTQTGSVAGSKETLPGKPTSKVRRDRGEPPVPRGHRGKVFTVVFSPDGQKVVSGSADGTVKLWDAATAQLVLTMPDRPAAAVTSLTYETGGRNLALGRDDGAVELWDLLKRKRAAVFQGSSGRVGSLAFSPDGKMVASGRQDGTVEWGDFTGSKKVPPPFKGQESWPVSMKQERWGRVCGTVLSPNGKYIAWARTDGGLTVWSLEKREIRGTYAKFQGPISVTAFSPDSNTLASASDDGTVKLWMRCGKDIATCRGHAGIVRCIAFALDGRLLATGGDDRTVRLWDTNTGQQQALFTGNRGPVLAVAFSPDGRKVAWGCADHSVRIWDRSSDTIAQAK